MTSFLYDGSFEGLLTTVGKVVEQGGRGAEIVMAGEGQGLLFPGERIVTCPEAARLLLTGFHAYAGEKGLRLVLLLFLADRAPRERLILDYIRLTLEKGRDVGGWLTHPVVSEASRMAAKVSREVHRFTGLLRFREVADGSFYAPFEPDHHIVSALAPRFARRMRQERWLIHDRGRGLGVFWDGKDLIPVALEQDTAAPGVSQREEFFQECWRRYHQSITLKERRNPNLQKQFMPVRYWRYLTELGRG